MGGVLRQQPGMASLHQEARSRAIPILREPPLAYRLVRAVAERHRVPPGLYTPVAKAYTKALRHAERLVQRALKKARRASERPAERAQPGAVVQEERQSPP
jgi:hypothetical protein